MYCILYYRSTHSIKIDDAFGASPAYRLPVIEFRALGQDVGVALPVRSGTVFVFLSEARVGEVGFSSGFALF